LDYTDIVAYANHHVPIGLLKPALSELVASNHLTITSREDSEDVYTLTSRGLRAVEALAPRKRTGSIRSTGRLIMRIDPDLPEDGNTSVLTPTVRSVGTAPTFISSDQVPSSSGELFAIPASDRFIKIDHNSQSFKDAEESVRNVITAVRQSNDLFATEEERLFVERELSDLEKLFQGDVLRIGAIKQYTEGSGTVAYLYQKGKDGIVGSVAWECLKAIGKLIADCLR
jgi:hypothetical protein